MDEREERLREEIIDEFKQRHAGDGGREPDLGGREPRQSRGDRYDELANGGRGPESVTFDRERDGDDELE
jgi:hypothetical protein